MMEEFMHVFAERRVQLTDILFDVHLFGSTGDGSAVVMNGKIRCDTDLHRDDGDCSLHHLRYEELDAEYLSFGCLLLPLS